MQLQAGLVLAASSKRWKMLRDWKIPWHITSNSAEESRAAIQKGKHKLCLTVTGMISSDPRTNFACEPYPLILGSQDVHIYAQSCSSHSMQDNESLPCCTALSPTARVEVGANRKEHIVLSAGCFS